MTNEFAGTAGRPLRVLCCSGSLDGGGSERQLWQLACKLDRNSFTPSIYLLYRRGPYVDQLPTDVGLRAFWDDFDEHQRFFPGRIRRLQIAHLASVLRELRTEVVYDRTFHMTLITSAAARRARVPRVSVIVSPPSADFQNSRERFRWLKRSLLQRAYGEKGAVTVAVSDDVADDAAKFYRIDRSRIRVLPNPVDIDAVRRAANAHVPEVRVTDAPRIVVVGRLSREKGQRLAIAAFSAALRETSTKMELDIVGDGPDRAELQRTVAELGLEDRVHFHGFLTNPYPYIRAARALCIPSEHEGLPNVALEAMAMGTNVIATNCSGALQTLLGKNERGQLVPPSDITAMAQAFVAVTAFDGGKFEAQRESGKIWVEQNHALAPWLEAMQCLLKSAAHTRHF